MWVGDILGILLQANRYDCSYITYKSSIPHHVTIPGNAFVIHSCVLLLPMASDLSASIMNVEYIMFRSGH